MAAGSHNNRPIIIALVVGLVVGWFVFAGSADTPSRKDDRPFLKWVARAAKNLLWIALVAEDPPEEIQPVKAEVGEDGYVMVDHGRGW